MIFTWSSLTKLWIFVSFIIMVILVWKICMTRLFFIEILGHCLHTVVYFSFLGLSITFKNCFMKTLFAYISHVKRYCFIILLLLAVTMPLTAVGTNPTRNFAFFQLAYRASVLYRCLLFPEIMYMEVHLRSSLTSESCKSHCKWPFHCQCDWKFKKINKHLLKYIMVNPYPANTESD